MFEFFARGLHRGATGADLGEAGNDFVYLHGGLLGVFSLFVVLFFIQA
jgi:hypothetical protein